MILQVDETFLNDPQNSGEMLHNLQFDWRANIFSRWEKAR